MMKRTIFFFLLSFSVLASAQKNRNLEISKQLDIFNSLYRELELNYIDTLDAKKAVEGAIKGLLMNTDPYTGYYPADETSDLKQMITGKYAGIGAFIRYNKSKDRCLISEPHEGMPAIEVGLKAGDIILSLDGKEMNRPAGMSATEFLESVSQSLRGEPGTTFELVVERQREKKPLRFKITRRNIQLPAIPYYGTLADSIGYLFLSSFTEGCAREVRTALADLKQRGAKSLLLDLRSNPGGSLAEAVEIVSLFVPKGQLVVSTRGKVAAANASYKTTKEPFDLALPLVVLVSSESASASEIVAGALQDLDRAVVVGQRTFGKGLVQQSRHLPYEAMVKLTTSKYFIPSGRCIQALDYRHRNDDGTPIHTPDSLTTVFRTAAGREVRDGGGITPDVKIEPDSLSAFVFSVERSDEFFSYVTDYLLTHTPHVSAADYRFPDSDYPAFKAAMSGFTYERTSARLLERLREIVSLEGYASEAKEEIEALAKKLSPSVENDLERWQAEIKRLLAEEIIRRTCFQRGVIQHDVAMSEEVAAAKRVLQDIPRYQSLLSK